MKNRDKILNLLEEGNTWAIQHFTSELAPSEIADAISGLKSDVIWRILRSMEIHQAGQVMGYFDLDLQVDLSEKMPKEDLAPLISHMLSDEGADLIDELPEPLRNNLMPLFAHAKRQQLLSLSSYEEGTCGSIMNADYIAVPPMITVAQAIEKVRLEAPNTETIYYVYVTNEQNRLLGMVSLRDLIIADPRRKVKDIMFTDLEFVHNNDAPIEAARIIEKYDLLAVPVINENNALVGIITHDDAADVTREEQTEDILGMGKVVPSVEVTTYLKSSPWENFKKRIPWIITLAALGLISGSILHSFQNTLSSLIILALYMPMLADTGGNCGTQASTVIIRALALREVAPKNILRVFAKELVVGLMMSVLMAALAFGKVMLLSGGEALPIGFTLVNVALMIGLALGIQVVSSTLIGAMLPLGVAALKLDPALIASPALTTIVDMTGLLVYFMLAKFLLGV